MNLFNIPMVSILLSIIIAWALFAMLCSMIHEAVAQAKAERGRFMKRYLFQQLQDLPNGVNWASLLYLHGTIDLLSRDPSKPTNDIAPHLFAEALIEVVSNAQIVKISAAKIVGSAANSSTSTPTAGNNYNSELLSNFKLATQVLQPSDAVSFLHQSLKSAELSALASGAANNEGLIYNHLVLNIEKWYNEFTQRLTLWYSKTTKKRLLILGIILGLLLNVDSIQLFKIFNTNPQIREAVIGYYQKNAATLVSDTSNSSEVNEKKITDFLNRIDTANQSINLPVGTQHSFLLHPWQPLQDWLWKLLGVLISGLAASLGAPFWFNILKKATSQK